MVVWIATCNLQLVQFASLLLPLSVRPFDISNERHSHSTVHSTRRMAGTSTTITNIINGDDDDFAALVEWELNKRRGRSATYTQPLIGGKHPMSIDEEENVHSFLSEFYSYQIFDNMMDMKHTLQLYSDTVAVHYGLLVPKVCSFDEFWSRYYYRCSLIQVKKDLMARQQRTGSFTVDDCSDSTANLDSNDNNNTNSASIDVAVEQQQPLDSEALQSIDDVHNGERTTTATTNNNNRTQMFYQENDRDIIEVIPEEENDDECDGEFDTVCFADNHTAAITNTVPTEDQHVAIGLR